MGTSEAAGQPRIRLIRPWGMTRFETPYALFSTELPVDAADAVVCEWMPSEELVSFPGPSAWYNCEPWSHSRMGIHAHPEQDAFLRRIQPHQLLHHAQADPGLRVPHVTHHSDACIGYEGPRHRAVAAVVSNAGGSPGHRWPDVRLRNAFVTSRDTHLYGVRGKWRWYRARRTSWPKTPRSYVGTVDEGLEMLGVPSAPEGAALPPDQAKLQLLARYHAAICLENTCEPWYFTEKFVDAVRAGCVPIYRAHPTVRDGVLQGAAWVDPADFGLEPEATLAAALSLDRTAVAEQNRDWLGSPGVRETSHASVWSRIAKLVLRSSPPT